MANALQNARLKLYVEAERAILSGQSYTIGNRQLTRANLSEVRKEIDNLVEAGATLDDVVIQPRRMSMKRSLAAPAWTAVFAYPADGSAQTT